MIGMATLPGLESLPAHVVLNVGCRYHNGRRPGRAKDALLERSETGRIEMLDHLHESGGVEPFQPLVPVSQRAVKKADLLTLRVVHGVEPQPAGGLFQ